MPPLAWWIPAAFGNRRKKHINHARIMPYARLRAERFIHAIRVAPRQLRTRPHPEHREITEGRLSDIREGGEGWDSASHRRRRDFECAANQAAISVSES